MQNKSVLITGCSSGFGRLLVSAFLESGWTVLATLRNAENRKSLFTSDLEKFGARLEILNFDVTSQEDLSAIVLHIKNNYQSRLDCLINNAGYGVYSALEDASAQQIQSQIDINLTGLILTTKRLLPFLRNAKGHLINFSSVLGFSTLPLTSLYCATKFAVEGLSEALYYELLPHQVRVSLIEPGSFATDFKANLLFGEQSELKTSAFYFQTLNYQKYLRDFSKNAGDPDVVVKAVLRVAKSSAPPLRVRVGKDSKAVYLVKRLVPEAFFRLLNRIFFGMTINKK